MAIDIKCKLVSKLSVQSGNSARGEWSKQDFIVETIETYPRKICMNVWGGDKIAELTAYNEGDELNISVNIESREFNGRWYTEVRAWRVQKESAQTPANQPSTAPETDPFMNVGDSAADEDGDLPF